MITYAQAAFLGLLQGVTELFPISSLGHSVLVPALLRWPIDQSSDQFLSFVVLTHLATALALVAYYLRDWIRIVRDTIGSLLRRRIDTPHAKLGWLIIVSTVPAGLVGLAFQMKLQALFANPKLVAVALVLNGAILFIAEILRVRAPETPADDRKLARLSWAQAIVIGVAQCLALIPGFSRTGSTMTAGLYEGLSHENAARYSFLLATPIILAAAALKVPHALKHAHAELGVGLVGALCAGLAAYLSVRFLTRYFRTKTLKPFALYCVVFGALAFALLTF